MTRHDTTRHDTTRHDSCALKTVVIGNLQGVVHALTSIRDSKRYICDSVITENYYGVNFWKYFFHRSSFRKKLRLLLQVIQAYRSVRINHKNIFRGIRVYYNSDDMSAGLFDMVPQKVFDEADVFLIVCNDNSSSMFEQMTSDYASGLIKRGISKEKIFVVPNTIYSYGADIPVIDGETLSPLCKKLSDVRPVLRYMEYHDTDFCNLKCKGCGHLANKVRELEFAVPDKFRLSLEKLKEKFANITVLRIMGGEPLLCKELYEYIDAAHEVFPYSQVKIVTNGLLYRNITARTIESIRKASAEIQITQYPPTRKIANEILSFCEENGLKVLIDGPVKFFLRRILSDKNKSFRDIWFSCRSRYCHFLHGTVFFPCPRAWTQSDPKFRDVITKELLSESERNEYSYDLTGDIADDGWDILMKFESPISVCSKCGDKLELFEWESEAGIK